MSKTTSHVSAIFDLQRNAIEQTHEAVKRSVDAQQEFGEAFVDFGPAKQANEHSYEAVRTGVEAYFDAVESVIPSQQTPFGEFRATVDEQLETLEATQIDAIESVESNVQYDTEAADELLEEYITALDEQSEAILNAHEDIEDQTVEAFEGNIEELQAEFEANTQQITENFEAQIAELQQQLETITETAQQPVTVPIDTPSESLTAINGLGPTYAGRLQEQGIESLEALTETTTEMVAKTAEVSEKQATEWIEAARVQA